MSAGAPGRPGPVDRYGLPAGDPLAARLFPPLPGRVEWGLERTRRILKEVGDPHLAVPVLHVGGTNGKGSVARIWASVLREAGLRVGLNSSPHLVAFRERILVNGAPLPDSRLEAAAAVLRPFFLREAPSFFEATTILAFLAMAEAGVDVAVIEVGLGGRLDTTNVVQPVLTAITNISGDHREYLGESLTEIAHEKAGILKPGIPAFTATDDPEALGELMRQAARVGAPLVHVPHPVGAFSLGGSRLRLETERWGPLELLSPLIGEHSLRNIALAVRALEALPSRFPIPGPAVVAGVAEARIPGRFQVVREGGRSWVLDVAHNPAGVEALLSTLRVVDPPRPWIGIVGILSDKEVEGMLPPMGGSFDRMVLTVPDSAPPARRWNPLAASALLPSGTGHAEPDLRRALLWAQNEAAPGGTVVVCGSSHTVGDVLLEKGWIPVEALPLPDDSG